MRKITFTVMIICLLFAATLYAQNGNLIVDGNIGIGTTTPAYNLDISGDLNINVTNPNNYYQTAINNFVQHTTVPASAFVSFEWYSAYTSVNANVPIYDNQYATVLDGSTTVSDAMCFYTRPYMQSSGNIGTFVGFMIEPYTWTSNATGQVDTMIGLYAASGAYGGGATTQYTNWYQAKIDNPAASGHITNAFGLLINNITAGSTSNYAIYSSGGLNYFGGNVGIGTQSPTHLFQLSGGAYSDGATWVNASSRELKENIDTLSSDAAIKTLDGLTPVTFNYKTDAGDRHVGFIAEDVPDLVATKDRKGLSAMDIVAVLTKVVQEQRRTMEVMQDKIDRLEKLDKTIR